MILVIGASGYVGRHILRSLGSEKATGTFWSNPFKNGFQFNAIQMSLRANLQGEHHFSHGIILYAEAGVDECKADLKRSQEINVNSTKRVIDDLVEMGIKPVFTSSEYVYEGDTGDYTELDPTEPTTVYGQQKLEIEQYLNRVCADYTVLRLAKVFGSDPSEPSILSGWHRQLKNGDEIQCARDQVYSPIHVDDVVSMVNAAINQDLNGIYNVANVQNWSRLEMLRTFVQYLGPGVKSKAEIVECSLQDISFLDPRPFNLSMNPTKMIQDTGINPITVEAACQDFLTRV